MLPIVSPTFARKTAVARPLRKPNGFNARDSRPQARNPVVARRHTQGRPVILILPENGTTQRSEKAYDWSRTGELECNASHIARSISETIRYPNVPRRPISGVLKLPIKDCISRRGTLRRCSERVRISFVHIPDLVQGREYAEGVTAQSRWLTELRSYGNRTGRPQQSQGNQNEQSKEHDRLSIRIL